MGMDVLFNDVCLVLLPFGIVPFSSLPIVLQSLFNVACRRVLLGVGSYTPQKRNATEIGRMFGDCSG